MFLSKKLYNVVILTPNKTCVLIKCYSSFSKPLSGSQWNLEKRFLFRAVEDHYESDLQNAVGLTIPTPKKFFFFFSFTVLFIALQCFR